MRCPQPPPWQAPSADDVRARAAWSRIAEPGDPVALRLIAALGPAEALTAVRTRRESVVDRFRPRLALLDIDRDLHLAARVGARLVVPGEPQWPAGLDDLDDPPYCLWVRGPGDLGAAMGRSVAVVGARAASSYGTQRARELAAGLAQRGFAVVSGAALGIDGAAHEGALTGDGHAVAVLAGGVERTYPAAHDRLIARIAETGNVVSEAAPGSAPMRHRFLQRNRLIATMTGGTVVVEAGLRSGSRNTAATAARYARVVGALPGPVTSMTSAGCHEMIRDGAAVLVTDAAEVADLVGGIGSDLAVPRPGPARLGDQLDPVDRRVFQALTGRCRRVEQVAVVAGLSVAEVLAALGRIELAGLARRGDGGWGTASASRR